jgi:hypothetical protein
MKIFDKMFAQAVGALLEEKEGSKPAADQPARPPAKSVILWNPGKGSWGAVVKGLKHEADESYDDVIAKSAVSVAKSQSLMGRLGITKKATSKDPLEAANEVLSQAVASAAMSQLYGTPAITPEQVSVPVVLSMEPDDIASGEGVSGRNATVYIHLTLLGAYNAGKFDIPPGVKLRITTASPSSKAVIVQKV